VYGFVYDSSRTVPFFPAGFRRGGAEEVPVPPGVSQRGEELGRVVPDSRVLLLAARNMKLSLGAAALTSRGVATSPSDAST
jgi:hypothetical protein